MKIPMETNKKIIDIKYSLDLNEEIDQNKKPIEIYKLVFFKNFIVNHLFYLLF